LREERRLRGLENRVLRVVFWLRRIEETGEWRKLHIEEQSLPNILWVVKSRPIRGNWENPDVLDGRIILRWIFSKWEGFVLTEWNWFRIEMVGGPL
jgi:hypothetical protein